MAGNLTKASKVGKFFLHCHPISAAEMKYQSIARPVRDSGYRFCALNANATQKGE